MTNIRGTAESYHLYAGPIDDHNLQLWEEKFDIALPIAASVLGGEPAALALRKRFLPIGFARDEGADKLTTRLV